MAGNPWTTESGNPHQTPKNPAEQKVAPTHNLMQYIIEHSNSAVAVHDRDLRYIYVSQRYLDDYQVTEKNIIGRHHYEIFPDLPQKWRDVHQKALSGSVSSADRDLYMRADGTEVWTRWECRPWYAPDGSIGGIIVYTEVITDRVRAEESLQQAQKMEAIGALAGGIAHDFNNLLFPIIGHAEMILEDLPADSPFQNGLRQIHTGSLRARELVHQILAFSRQEKNEQIRMRLQPIVKEALKLIRSSIPATIAIRQQISSDCGPVRANPVQIHQILMNLATNAFHAMEEDGGTLTVSLDACQVDDPAQMNVALQPGPCACLTVADTGPGMDPEILEKIFEPYFTTKVKGTGIGLSVVKGIITAMNGAMQVLSTPGRGTQFRVYLPLEENRPDTDPDPAVQAPLVGGSERILLVDDEKPVIAMETQILSRMGYQVTPFTSSIQALAAFKANPGRFDLVITDIAMPDMSGDKLTVELQRIRPGMPILLCTGFSERMTPVKIEELGVRGVLTKPMLTRDLDRTLRDIFRPAAHE
jgi:PAS domain S-box-containing protein